MAKDENLRAQLEKVTAERDAAVADLERLMWITGSCKYCAKNKSKTGQHQRLDRPCRGCEPKWRGPKERKYEEGKNT